MVRKGFCDILHNNSFGTSLVQYQRRGSPDLKQLSSMQVTLPLLTTLCDYEGRFENPRKAPLPQGPKLNSLQLLSSTAPSESATSSLINPISNLPDGYQLVSVVLTVAGKPATEFGDLSKVSIFSLPKFDLEKEIKMLQCLWSKRWPHLSSVSVLCRRSRLPEDLCRYVINEKESSFFETDSESEKEESNWGRYYLGRSRLIVVNNPESDVLVVTAHFHQ